MIWVGDDVAGKAVARRLVRILTRPKAATRHSDGL